MKIDLTKTEIEKLRPAILLAITSEEIYLQTFMKFDYMVEGKVNGYKWEYTDGWGEIIKETKSRIRIWKGILDKIEKI